MRRQETGHDHGRLGCRGTSMVEKPPYKTNLVENLHSDVAHMVQVTIGTVKHINLFQI